MDSYGGAYYNNDFTCNLSVVNHLGATGTVYFTDHINILHVIACSDSHFLVSKP